MDNQLQIVSAIIILSVFLIAIAGMSVVKQMEQT
jgi:hypothetical protein